MGLWSKPSSIALRYGFVAPPAYACMHGKPESLDNFQAAKTLIYTVKLKITNLAHSYYSIIIQIISITIQIICL